MPIYEYKCKNCDDVFEEFQSMGASSESLKCPKCGTTAPDRLFSAFASSVSNTGNAVSSGSSCSSGSPFT